MNSCEKWVKGVSLLREFLEDDLVLARALREKRLSDLLAAVEIAHVEVDTDLAMTDPALYTALRNAITKFYLFGYACIDLDTLRALVLSSEPRPE